MINDDDDDDDNDDDNHDDDDDDDDDIHLHVVGRCWGEPYPTLSHIVVLILILISIFPFENT